MRQLLLLATLLLPVFTRAQAPAERPNIVLIFCDDLGYGDLGCFGNPVIRTPNLDKMAAEGIKFTNFYACSPACTASRYALLTGKYPVRSGFSWVLGPTSTRGIHPQEITLAEALKSAGYATACFGKWHLGTTKRQFLPLQNGFDRYFGLPYSNDMIPPIWGDIALMEGNDTLAINPDQSDLTEQCARRAIDFISEKKGQPFFIYLPFNMPHVPLRPGKNFVGRSPRGAYGDVVEELDFWVGQIRQTLEKEGLAEKTLLFFTSDNGPWLIKKEDAGSSGLLRDGKGSTWEGGMRVPAIAWQPGRVPAGKICTQPTATIDLYRTFCTLAEAPATEHQPDGENLATLLRGAAAEAVFAERPFFYYGPGNQLQAVRQGPWKLHLTTNTQLDEVYFLKKTNLLFHLDRDPSEKYECAEQQPEVVQKLLQLVENHRFALGPSPGFYDQERASAQRKHSAFEKKITFNIPPSPRYPNPIALTDGWQEAPEDFNHLAGFEGTDMDFVLDLEEPMQVHYLTVGFLQSPVSWIFLPSEVRFSSSTDGVSWQNETVVRHEVPLEKITKRHAFAWRLAKPATARFVRVFAKNIGVCPAWHTGAGKPAWMFADEIEVE